MDEFRKPFEYEEEKGVSGLLLIFFVMLLSCESLLGVIAAIVGYNEMTSLSLPGIVFVVSGIIFVILPLFTAFALKKLPRAAVRISKVYLIVRVIYYLPFTVVNSIIMIQEITYAKGYPDYDRQFDSIVTGGIISAAYIVLFSFLWYLYFNKSRKVKDAYTDIPVKS